MDRYTLVKDGIAKNMSLFHPLRIIQKFETMLQKDASFNETFMEQNYHWLAEQLRPGTTVIDIGANIGDTAIYFAQFREVEKVIAYEPFPYTYSLLLRYVGRCPLKHKIVAKNEAVGEKSSTVTVSDEERSSGSLGINAMESDRGTPIKVTGLSEALKGKKRVAIKCDCEGAEERLFNVDLSSVYAVMLEWHGIKARDGAVKALRDGGLKVRAEKGLANGLYGRQGYAYAVR